MTKIKLQSIAINNFKGIRFLKLNMEGKNSNIQGANGSGKTTIYKAYYWCLTGNTMEPNETVQTLDQNNEVIHKIETSVMIILLIDDSYEVTLERKLVEKWRALGMPDEQFVGTEQKQFFNEIPLSKAEFNAKLNGICDLNKWILLSNINAFMALKTEDRRKMLMDMAGELDEQKLIAPYPAVMKAVNTEKKSVEELQKQALSTKKRCNDELKSIPAQIDAQDRLKVDADFAAVETWIEQLNTEIADIDRQLEGSTEELEAAKKQREKVLALRTKLDTAVKGWTENHKKEVEEANKAIEAARSELLDAERQKKEHTEDLVKKAISLKEKEEQFAAKKNEWMEVNRRTYTAETLTACPVCGHVFTEQEKIDKGNAAVEHFNKEKSEKLQSLLLEAGKIDEQIKVLTGVYNEGSKIIGPQLESLVSAKRTALNERITALASINLNKIEADPEIESLKAELSAAESEITQTKDNSNKDSLRVKKSELTVERDKLTKTLANRDINERIEKEKAKLNARAQELAQIVADCDNTLYQIMEYKKSKVGAIEGKINGMFQTARWKFFEKNVTDDNYKEICKCLHNGVDYNSTNAADRINLGVDIVSSIGKAYDIEAVIFVDFKESVAELINVDNQIISLEHVAGAELTMKS